MLTLSHAHILNDYLFTHTATCFPSLVFRHFPGIYVLLELVRLFGSPLVLSPCFFPQAVQVPSQCVEAIIMNTPFKMIIDIGA